MLVIIREEANTKVLCEFFTISWGRAVATLAVLAILYSFCLCALDVSQVWGWVMQQPPSVPVPWVSCDKQTLGSSEQS